MAGLKFSISFAGRTRKLDLHAPTVTVGRAKSCSLVLPYEWLAERHLIVQVDPPFARVKLMEPSARGSLNGKPLSTQWTRLTSGATLNLPAPTGEGLKVRIDPAHSNAQTTLVHESDPELGGDKFGVVFATESALDGSTGWMDDDTTSIAKPPISAQVVLEPKRPRKPGRILMLAGGTMALLVLIAVTFRVMKNGADAESLAQAREMIARGIQESDLLVSRGKYVAAKAELDKAKSLAEAHPETAEDLKKIIARLNREAIVKGANGQTYIEGRWLPDDVAKAWQAELARDNPKIAALRDLAEKAAIENRWTDVATHCRAILAMVDAHRLKEHPQREWAEKTVASADKEIKKQQMLAQGMVQDGDNWLTPEQAFEKKQLAAGLVNRKGQWMTKADAEDAEHKDRGEEKVNGVWMTIDAAMAAKDEVFFEGKRMTRTEKTAIIAQREREAMAERDAERRQSERIRGLNGTAFDESKQFVMKELGTQDAKFPPITDPRVRISFASNQFTVVGFVDAPDATGRRIRWDFRVILKPGADPSAKWQSSTAEVVPR